MKNLKRLCALLSVVLVCLIGFLVFLIINQDGGDAQVQKTYEKGSYKTYDLTEDYLKFLGRSALIDNKLYFSNSGSGIEFICKGAYAEITVCAENDYVYSNHVPRIAIFSDGNLVVDECVDYEEKTYRIDTSYNGTVIRLIKLSEAMYSSFAVSKVASYGMEKIEPVKENDLKIEFIGDSVTCGYGIDAGEYGSFSTCTENFTKTYAYLTAEKLSADFSAVCFSGYGILTGYTESGYINDKIIMNEYDKACLLSDGEDIFWNFDSCKNDLIVLNLGTNDASYCSGSSQRRQMFVDAYTDTLKALREKNPDSYILCVLGDVNNSLYTAVETAVSAYRNETGDERVQAYAIAYRMDENDIVIDGHPGEESNSYASEILTEKIRNLIETGCIG